MRSKQAGTPRHPAPADTEDIPALPVWKAFVVQFSRETKLARGAFSGRVEHISSGRRAQFASTAELIAVLGRLLGELGEE